MNTSLSDFDWQSWVNANPNNDALQNPIFWDGGFDPVNQQYRAPNEGDKNFLYGQALSNLAPRENLTGFVTQKVDSAAPGDISAYDQPFMAPFQQAFSGSNILTQNQLNDPAIAKFFDAQLQERGEMNALQTTRQKYGLGNQNETFQDNATYWEDLMARREQEDALGQNINMLSQVGQQGTSQYNPADTWGSEPFNPSVAGWDFDYYISQLGLGPAPEGPRPGSGAALYAAGGTDQPFQYEQYAPIERNIFGATPDMFGDQAQLDALSAATGQANTPSTQQQVAAQIAGNTAFNPSTDFSLQTSGGFPTRNGIQTGYWDENDQYNLPPVDYSTMPQFAGNAVDTGTAPNPGDIGGITANQVMANLGGQMGNYSMPDFLRTNMPGTQWEDSFMNFMDNPMAGGGIGEGGPSVLDQLIAGNYSLDNIGSDASSWIEGVGDNINSYLGNATGNMIGNDTSFENTVFGNSDARTAGKLAGILSIAGAGPLALGAEGLAGIFEMSNLNNQLSAFGADELGAGDALGAMFNPFSDLRDSAFTSLVDRIGTGSYTTTGPDIDVAPNLNVLTGITPMNGMPNIQMGGYLDSTNTYGPKYVPAYGPAFV